MTALARNALLPIAALQFLIPLLPRLGIGRNVGAAAREDYAGLPPEQPLSAMFSIWGVIFTLFAIFTVYALRKDDTLVHRLAPPLAFAGALNCIWMLSAQTLNLQLLNFALLFPIAFFAWAAARKFDLMRGMGGSAIKLTADAVTGLLSGWITVAIAISVPLTLRNVSSLGASDYPWQMLWATLITASLGAYLFSRFISRSLWFFVAAGWGLLGIILNNWYITNMGWLAIVTGIMTLIILYLRLTRGATGAAHVRLDF